MMHMLPPAAQEAIRDDLEGTHKYHASAFAEDTVESRHRQDDYDGPTGVIPTVDSPTVETRTVER